MINIWVISQVWGKVVAVRILFEVRAYLIPAWIWDYFILGAPTVQCSLGNLVNENRYNLLSKF